MQCTPWKSNGKSLKAWESEVTNTYVAFQIVFPISMVTSGEIEFKYKKDSKNSFITNGEFKFLIDG